MASDLKKFSGYLGDKCWKSKQFSRKLDSNERKSAMQIVMKESQQCKAAICDIHEQWGPEWCGNVSMHCAVT